MPGTRSSASTGCSSGGILLGTITKHASFTLVRDDLRTFDPAVLRGVDVVFDLAGISNDPACDLDPQITRAINLDGCVRLATLAKAAGVKRYVFSSSCSVYGQGSDSALTEDSALAPVSLYAECKIRAEEQLLALADDGFTVTILRNATVYGPSRRMRYDLLVNLMTAKAFTDRVIYVLGGGQQWRPNVHVRDVARAFIHVMEQPAPKVRSRVFNVGSNEQNFRVVDVAHIVRDVMPHVSIQVVPDDPDRRNLQRQLRSDSHRAGLPHALLDSRLGRRAAAPDDHRHGAAIRRAANQDARLLCLADQGARRARRRVARRPAVLMARRFLDTGPVPHGGGS